MLFILVLIYIFTGSNVHPNLCALLMPLILLSSALLGTGCGLIVSSVTTKYRDLGVLVSFGVTLWMYITPVVYPVSQVSDSFRPLALLNPVAPLIETFRYGFLGSGTFPWQYLILSFAVTVVVLLFGIIVFNRVEKKTTTEDYLYEYMAKNLFYLESWTRYGFNTEIDLSALEPYVNGPFTPDAACPVSEFAARVKKVLKRPS